MGGSDIFGVCSRRGLKGLCAARLLWVGDSVVARVQGAKTQWKSEFAKFTKTSKKKSSQNHARYRYRYFAVPINSQVQRYEGVFSSLRNPTQRVLAKAFPHMPLWSPRVGVRQTSEVEPYTSR